jgi:catechol 2,3-dioxygenase-like lactoylglutathione lyase family enzyme
MPATLQMATTIRFHLSLNVSDLSQSIAFYRVLFGLTPAKARGDYAKFELDEPPLVLSLEPSAHGSGGALNHLGFRMPDSASLVAMQRRLGEAGIHSRREEGVECCYARQTKFWVTDPDGTLWEIYTLDEDIDHRGPGQTREEMLLNEEAVAHPHEPRPVADTPTVQHVWEHRLGQAIPAVVPLADRSVQEVWLRGTLNEPHSAEVKERLMREACRVLRDGGRLFVHVLTADRPLASAPNLPGPAASVKHVPLQSEPLHLLEVAGLHGVRVLKLDPSPCFTQDGVEMHEMQLEGRKG